MEVTIAGNVFLLKGQFVQLTKAGATQAVLDAGGKISKSLTLKTNFLVCGEPAELQEITERAHARGVPIIDETQLMRALAGERVVLEQASVEPTLAGPEEEAAALDVLKELCGQPLADDTWHQICGTLDRCGEETQAVATDLVMELVNSQPLPEARYRLGEGPTADATPCFQPSAVWLKEILAGEDAPKFRTVRYLNLQGKQLTGRTGAPILECTNLSGLVRLNLAQNKFPKGFWQKIGDAPQFSAVRDLWVTHSRLDAPRAMGLARGSAFGQVKQFNLQMGNLSGGGVFEAFFGAGDFDELEELVVSSAELEPNEPLAIAAAGQLTQLKSLNLSGNTGLSSEAVSTMVKAGHLAGLERLDLGGTDINTSVLHALADAQIPLKRLDLGLNYDLDPAATVDLLTQPACSQLEFVSIDFTQQAMPIDLLTRLLSSPTLCSLREIQLSTKGLDDAFALLLAECGHLACLDSLNLYGVALTRAGFEALCAAPHLGSLSSLSVTVPDDAVSVVESASHWSDALKKKVLKWGRR